MLTPGLLLHLGLLMLCWKAIMLHHWYTDSTVCIIVGYSPYLFCSCFHDRRKLKVNKTHNPSTTLKKTLAWYILERQRRPKIEYFIILPSPNQRQPLGSTFPCVFTLNYPSVPACPFHYPSWSSETLDERINSSDGTRERARAFIPSGV